MNRLSVWGKIARGKRPGDEVAANTFGWRSNTRLQKWVAMATPETVTLPKLIKIKVPLHQFSNLMFYLHYMYLLN